MPKTGSHFTSQELAMVLSHYDIGVISALKPLSAGNSRAPKLKISASSGTYLLKRRPHGKDDPKRVIFAHQVQNYLQSQNFPIAGLIQTRDEHSTMLYINRHVYELFHFVTGSRYDGSAQETFDAGCRLALYHKLISGAPSSYKPPQQSFHDAQAVRRHLDDIESRDPSSEYAQLVTDLRKLYETCAHNVNSAGFYHWPVLVVHGDWHPGNMLFNDHKIIAVLDFDSLKIAPAPVDLANGMLQFSIVAGRPNPVDWPEYLDQSRLQQFINGYTGIFQIPPGQLKALCELMIETLISEATLPVAQTGYFGHLSGYEFLKMIYRKCIWIYDNRERLTDVIAGKNQRN